MRCRPRIWRARACSSRPTSSGSSAITSRACATTASCSGRCSCFSSGTASTSTDGMRRELYGEIRRREADHWWYVGRQRILFDWTRRAVARRTAPRLLDVGCGTGFNLEGLRALGVAGAVGLDVSAEALAYCQARGLRRLVRADGALLPFADSSFDVV